MSICAAATTARQTVLNAARKTAPRRKSAMLALMMARE